MIYVLVIAATFVVTTLAWLVLLNLMLGDKQIDEPFVSGCAVDSPQFDRMMCVLLGPAIVGGTPAESLSPSVATPLPAFTRRPSLWP